MRSLTACAMLAALSLSLMGCQTLIDAIKPAPRSPSVDMTVAEICETFTIFPYSRYDTALSQDWARGHNAKWHRLCDGLIVSGSH